MVSGVELSLLIPPGGGQGLKNKSGVDVVCFDLRKASY